MGSMGLFPQLQIVTDAECGGGGDKIRPRLPVPGGVSKTLPLISTVQPFLIPLITYNIEWLIQ